MIRATSHIDGPPLTLNASITGPAIYLDNFALIKIAKGTPSRRERFLAAIQSGAELLFSLANAAELTGPQGGSLLAVRTFLEGIGPHWFPVELDPFEVVQRELHGAAADESCVSQDFMKQHFASRTTAYSPGCGRIIDLSDRFFSLAAVLDWVTPQRESIRKGAADMDAALIARITNYAAEYERDPNWLDTKFPELPFRSTKPATFTYINLVRTLILESKAYRLKKGDGMDFCHAVMASAFANIATLDKQWKRRVESLPKPNKLAHIWYEPELDEMVFQIESALASC